MSEEKSINVLKNLFSDFSDVKAKNSEIKNSSQKEEFQKEVSENTSEFEIRASWLNEISSPKQQVENKEIIISQKLFMEEEEEEPVLCRSDSKLNIIASANKNKVEEGLLKVDTSKKLENLSRSIYLEDESLFLAQSSEKMTKASGIENIRPENSFLKSVSETNKSEVERLYVRRIQELQEETEIWKTKCSVIQRSKAQEIEDFQKSFYEVEQKDMSLKFQSEKKSHESEVRRLKDHNEKLKKDFDDQRMKSHKLELTLQDMKQAQEKTKEFESRINLLIQDNQRLNDLIRSKNEEIDAWKRKHTTLEISINDLRIFEGRCEDLQSKYTGSQQEVDRLRDRLRQRGEEVDGLRITMTDMEIKMKEIKMYETRITEYENKISLMTKEIERLNDVLRIRMEESEKYMESYKILETRVTHVTKYEEERKFYEEQILTLNHELADWKSRCEYNQQTSVEQGVMINEYKRELKTFTIEIESLQRMLKEKTMELERYHSNYNLQELTTKETQIVLEKRITVFNTEIENLNKIISEKHLESEKWKGLAQLNEAASKEKSLLEARLVSLENQIGGLEKEIRGLKDIIANHEEKSKVFEKRIILHTQEIERLTCLLNEKTEENHQLKAKLSSLDTLNITIRTLEGQLRDSEREIIVLTTRCEEYSIKITELEMGSHISAGFEARILEFEMRIALLTQEIERLRYQLSEKSQDIEEWKIKYSKLESSYQLQLVTNGGFIELEATCNRLTEEGDRLKLQLKELTEERDSLRVVIERYEILITEHQSFEEKNKGQEIIILQLRQEIEEWKKKYITLENSYKEYRSQHDTYRAEMDNRFELVIQQNDKLNSLLNEKHEEIEHVKKSARSSSTVEEAGKMIEYEKKTLTLIQEIERLTAILSRLQPEYEQTKLKLQSYIEIEIKYKEMVSLVTIFKSQISEFELQRTKWNEERSLLQDKVTQQDKAFSQVGGGYELRIKEYEAQLASSALEIKKLTQLLQSRLDEFEQSREKYKKLELVLSDYKLYELKYNEIQTKYLDLLNENDSLRSAKKELEMKFVMLGSLDIKISEYESRIQLFSSEIEKLNQVVLNKNKEIDEAKSFRIRLELEITELKEYYQKNTLLNQEIDRLHIIIKEYQEEVESWKMKFVEYGSLYSRIQEQLVVLVLAGVEIESLRARIIEKDNELAEKIKRLLKMDFFNINDENRGENENSFDYPANYTTWYCGPVRANHITGLNDKKDAFSDYKNKKNLNNEERRPPRNPKLG